MNTVKFIGNLGNDPEFVTFENGKRVAKFTLATNEQYVKNGETIQKTQWHRIVCWNQAADKAKELLQKGTFAEIKAKAVNREYEREIEIQVSPKKKVTHKLKQFVTEYNAYYIEKM